MEIPVALTVRAEMPSDYYLAGKQGLHATWVRVSKNHRRKQRITTEKEKG